MKQINIKLNEGQYLSNVEPFKSNGIPTDSIIHKVITGCGATTLEAEYTKRNSIIIVPNVPVIEDKVKEHNKKYPKEKHILGVHKGIDVCQIDDYLNSEATYKKILTTPEGFMTKVLEAFEGDYESMRKEYFLLFDECERIVTDVSYRGDIAAPIDWFFKFEQKAMVSATTLPFSHKGFEALNHYFIEPQYDYSKVINVINTNNVIESIEKHLKGSESDHVFIFLNSTDAIYNVIDTLGIRDESKVYCAEKSVAKLVSKKYKNASCHLDINGVAKYNFLTSRYFSALDIKLNYKPDVILISDVYTAEHSILDPHTEVIQIAGRFRNGIHNLTHITNFKSAIVSKSRDEAIHYLNGCFDTYEQVVKLFRKANHPGSKETLEFFVKHSPVANYYNDDLLNEFMVDNYLYEQRVAGYYQSFENLKKAYSELPRQFNPEYSSYEYELSDEDRINRQSNASIRSQQWETLRQIDVLTYKPVHGRITIRIGNSDNLLTNLRSLYPWLTEAYDLLGFEGLQKTGLAASNINPAKARAKEIKELKLLAPYIYEKFEAGTVQVDSLLKKTINDIVTNSKVDLKPTNSLINKFFNAKRSTINGEHCHNLTDKVDLEKLTPFDASIQQS